ncbi:MAG: tetratricopeptide repeat protein [Proteobacteria bacterium]|nr:tetratricopeptide repeat protein [Pseudomonadota bacterium]
MLARALASSGEERESLALANRLADNGDTAGRLRQAGVLLLLRHEGAARAVLESLLDSPAQGADALQMLGQLLLQDGDLSSAESCFLRLIKSGRHVDDAFFDLGRIAERRGEEEAALRLYSRVNEGGHALGAMLRAAALLKRRGLSAETDQLFEGLVADVPARAPQIIAARAQLYADAGEATRGLELLDQALGEYPDSTELQFKHAELLDSAHRLRASLRALDELRRRRPDDPTALNALGFTLADHGMELPRARRLIERALAQAPQSAAIRDSLGWVLYRQGLPEQALPHLSAAFEVDRGAETGAHMGEVLWALNRRDEARRVWAQARLDDPRDPVLQATLRRLGAGD